jgi:hypothetical protein
MDLLEGGRKTGSGKRASKTVKAQENAGTTTKGNKNVVQKRKNV